MSDVFASLASGTLRSGGSAPAGGAGETAVRVIDPSPDLSRLTTGENLRGTVVGKDDHGHLLVRTRLGVLQLAAHRSLPVGSEVILQVRSVGPQVVLNLLPLDSAAAAGSQPTAPQAAQAPQATQAQSSPALPPNPHDLVQRGQVIRGVLHAAAPLPLLAGLPTAQPGAELLVRILSFGVQSQAGGTATTPGPAASQAAPAANAGAPAATVAAPTAAGSAPAPGATAVTQPGNFIPGNAPSNTAQAAVPTPGQGGATATAAAPQKAHPATPAPAGSTTAPATPPASGGNTTPAATTAGATPPGLRLAPQTPVANSGHTVATALQSVTSEAAARAAGGNLLGATPTNSAGAGDGALRLTGLVTATSNNGQPILHTPLGTITLDTRASLPPGSSLALQVSLPAAQNSPAAQALAAAWPSLEALEETLFHSLPPAQMEAVARALPQIGPRLASGVLFFLSALNQGNPLGWLAPAAAAAAERGEHRELFERLGRDFAGLNRAIETPAGEWRFVNLPLWSADGLRELRCFFRHQDHGGGGKGDGDKATRFVLELDLQRHGELQLDGLVRGKRFDLMLRSRRPLPAVARGDLLALFEEANAIAGYTGQLVFQASGDWLQLLAAEAGGEHHEGFRV